MTIKILNLYAGIGGNRKLWKGDIEVTAVESDGVIAWVYKKFFPEDEVIQEDAHEYLLKNFHKFDFIWSSPPCPTHSRMRKVSIATGTEHKFPDMKLYEEILFLKHWFKGKWVVENVISYYDPLIKPQEAHRHYFWSNFNIPTIKLPTLNIRGTKEHYQKLYDIDLSKFNVKDKRQLLRNCVHPKLGLHIFKQAFKDNQNKLFALTNKQEGGKI